MNILITGGAGYIGSHVCEELVKNKTNKIYILDNLSTGHKRLINKKAYFIKGDIKNFSLVKKIFIKHKIETVIHLAASLNVSEAEKDKKKYYQNNIIGTKNLILSCKNLNIKNFIFSSSSSIYGNTKGDVDETKKPNPKMFYAYTKYEGEKLIKKYSRKFKFNYAILRYFNVAGASKSGQIGDIETSHGHLIKNIAIEALKINPEINIYGNNYPTKDGTCIRDYIHVSDLADIHVKSLHYLNHHNKSFILNCGYGKGYSVKQVVNIFKKIKKNLTINYKPKRPGDVAQMYSNTKKLKQTFKWKAKFNNINLIIKSAIKWEKKLSTLK